MQNKYDESDAIRNEYFEWMYHLVCNDKHYSKVSYRKLLIYLDNVEFKIVDPMDDNRAHDGIDMRLQFAYNNGYPESDMKKYLGTEHCSVFEMMIGLAYRVEEQIMTDNDYGNRTGQWFWSMIVSLGLGQMNDYNFDKSYCDFVIDRFMSRNYSYDGKGGLFTLRNPARDLRDVEIWCQCMWYLNEIVDEQGG